MMNAKGIIGMLILLILSTTIFGQGNSSASSYNDIISKLQEKKNGEGEVVVFQDMRINNLIYNHIEQNKRSGGIPGYRIRIYSNLGSEARDQSQTAKAKFYERFPEIPIYREYESPYFRVIVGDYRTRIDALKDFNQIKRIFPSAFIIPDKINFPELEK
jgi:hypothetical protein